MIFGKDNSEFDFDSFKEDVSAAADPLVEAVRNYEPNKKKRPSYKSPMADLPESAGLFFRSAADALDKNATSAKNDQTLDTGDLAKKAGGLFGWAGDATDNATQAVKGAKLDKKLGNVADNVTGAVKDAKLDKKLANLADNVSGSVKDAKLDKKLASLTDSVTGTVKDAKLDKKLAGLTDTVSGTVRDAKLDKKLGDVVGTVGETLTGVAATVGGALAEAKLDKKLADVTGNVTSTVRDAKLDKKLADVTDNVFSTVKEAKLDKKASELLSTAGEVALPVAATVAETVGTVANTALEAVGGFIKENQLDKKASELLSTAGDKTSQALKDAQLDKKLAQAQLPEKFFETASNLPGVNIKNPKKAAKAFRKRRAQLLKQAQQQQKELSKQLAQRQKEAGKLLSARQQDAQKFIEQRRKDLKAGKFGPVQPTKKKGSLWGKAARWTAIGGLVYGGLAYNNNRIWSAIAPLESKLPGDNRYFNSRQGLIFYKEAGQEQEGKAPVVFVHGIGAGNHSYEWLHNFDEFGKQYKVYAYDLLGFGNSAKPNIRYTAETYIKQLTEFLDEVVGQPAYVVASSLAAAYAVQVAYRRPELVKKLLLASPTGINRQGGKPSVQILPSFAYFLLRAPVLGKALYSLVASRADIRSFAETQMFYDKGQVTDEMVQQYYVASHQPGAEFAPPSFFTGLLDAEIGQTLGKLDKPIMMIFGKQSLITPIWEAEALKEQNPQARLEELDNARLLVHWEHADEFNRLGLEFLNQPERAVKPQVASSTKSGVGLNQTGPTERQFTDKPETPAQKVADKVGEAADQVKDNVKGAAGKLTQTNKGQETVPAAKANVNQKEGQTSSVKNSPTTSQDNADQIRRAADELAQDFKQDAQDADAAVEAKMQPTQTRPTTQGQPNRPSNPTGTTNQPTGQANNQSGNSATRQAGSQPSGVLGNTLDEPAGDLSQTMSHYNQQAKPGQEGATEYPGDHDLQKELREHRETFIGDSDTGAALVEDKDRNGVDDRRMPPLG